MRQVWITGRAALNCRSAEVRAPKDTANAQALNSARRPAASAPVPVSELGSGLPPVLGMAAGSTAVFGSEADGSDSVLTVRGVATSGGLDVPEPVVCGRGVGVGSVWEVDASGHIW